MSISFLISGFILCIGITVLMLSMFGYGILKGFKYEIANFYAIIGCPCVALITSLGIYLFYTELVILDIM